MVGNFSHLTAINSTILYKIILNEFNPRLKPPGALSKKFLEAQIIEKDFSVKIWKKR